MFSVQNATLNERHFYSSWNVFTAFGLECTEFTGFTELQLSIVETIWSVTTIPLNFARLRNIWIMYGTSIVDCRNYFTISHQNVNFESLRNIWIIYGTSIVDCRNYFILFTPTILNFERLRNIWNMYGTSIVDCRDYFIYFTPTCGTLSVYGAFGECTVLQLSIVETISSISQLPTR